MTMHTRIHVSPFSSPSSLPTGLVSLVRARSRPSGLIAAGLALLASPVLWAANLEISDPALPHNFSKQPVGSTFATQYFSVFNRGTTPVAIGQAKIDGGVATCAALGCPTVSLEDFTLPVETDGCSNRTLPPQGACSTLLGFTPKSGGTKLARLVFPTSVADTPELSTTLTGTGRLDADRVFDWAESILPALFTPSAPSFYVAGYYARCYGGLTTCLGSLNGQSFLFSGGVLTSLGRESAILEQASKAGF